MSKCAKPMILLAAAVLILAGCSQQSEKPAEPAAPVANTQPAPVPQSEPTATKVATTTPAEKSATKPSTPKPEAPVAMTPKPATTAPAPAPVKPEATAPEAPKSATTKAMNAPRPSGLAATSPKPESVSTGPFSTMKCMACHAVEHDKVGPAWKTVVGKYGDEAALAKDFEAGFKERRVANSIAKWKSKEALMTMQYKSLIKGHGKSAAHALFMTVKNGKFGTY